MEDQFRKMVHVCLRSGAWYSEPDDYHVFLHIVRSRGTGRLLLVTTTAETSMDAENALYQGTVLATISLFDLLQITNVGLEVEVFGESLADSPVL